MDEKGTLRYQREAEAWEAYAVSEGLHDITSPCYVKARHSWKAALLWKEGRAMLDITVHFDRGDRVVVNKTSGFHKGATGVVEFVEPSGRVWVLRDLASAPAFFYPTELDKVIPPPPAQEEQPHG